MTKKSLSEMSAFDIAGVMILANVAAEPLVDKVVLKSIFGIGLLILLISITAKLALVNKLTPYLEHTATIIIENGKINTHAMKKNSLSLNQLQGLLREKGYDEISDIQTAIFEPTGNLSVFPKAKNKVVTLKDLGSYPLSKDITIPLIFDGQIIDSALKHLKKNEEWIVLELKKLNVKIEEILLAEIDDSWNIKVHKK